MSDRLRIGVVGVGHLGSIHAKLLSAMQQVELVALYDADTSRAAAVAAEHGSRATGTLDELLEQVEAVSIVTPTSTHAEVAHRAIEFGRHLFIEKPITATAAEGWELIERARRAGLVLQVGHIERFNPALRSLHGTALDPMFIEAHRLSQFRPRATDVAVVHDLMIHDIDLVLSLVDDHLVEIRASGVGVVTDTVDIANARLEFSRGCVANLTASRISQRPMRKVRIFQRDAYISLDLAEGSSEVFRIAEEERGDATSLLGAFGSLGDGRRIVYERPEIEQSNALQSELESFASAVRGEGAPAVGGEEGCRALEIAERIVGLIESARGVAQG